MLRRTVVLRTNKSEPSVNMTRESAEVRRWIVVTDCVVVRWDGGGGGGGGEADGVEQRTE
jgi:hypothetical protein